MKKRFLSIHLATTLALFFALFLSCSKSDLSGDSAYYDSSKGGIAGDGDTSYDPSGEGYNEIVENPFIATNEEPVSTFSIDADGASYSNVRRFLEDGLLPPKYAVRTEEFINYFHYDYDEPTGGHPISLQGEISACPWTPGHKLMRIGIKGKHIEEFPACNFVFLIDCSGSMQSDDKLGLLKDAFRLFTDQLRPEDRISLVTYAGGAGVVLPSTSGSQKDKIKSAISKLDASGSTNGAGGIIKAYEQAVENMIPNGNNRVILATDGDFNVGISSEDELVKLIEEKRTTGVFLSVLGVGTGNYQDGKMEQLANNGNGTYEYIDDMEQAEKVFVHEFGKFFTVAKDVKVQVEFNPNVVARYRLIGYENRVLQNEEFEDDTKDAGEIGADQTITALYELEMVPVPNFNQEAFNVQFRYKNPDSDDSQLLSLSIPDAQTSFVQASENMRFATTVAGFGLMLGDSDHKGTLTWDKLIEWANSAIGSDELGWRKEFVQWVEKAKDLQ
jgi:Ca-activated chloride channel family protein